MKKDLLKKRQVQYLGYLITVAKSIPSSETTTISESNFGGVKIDSFGTTIGSMICCGNVFIDAVTGDDFPILPVDDLGVIVVDETINPNQLYVCGIQGPINIPFLKEMAERTVNKNKRERFIKEVERIRKAAVNLKESITNRFVYHTNFSVIRFLMKKLKDEKTPHYTDPVIQEKLAVRFPDVILSSSKRLQKKINFPQQIIFSSKNSLK